MQYELDQTHDVGSRTDRYPWGGDMNSEKQALVPPLSIWGPHLYTVLVILSFYNKILWSGVV